MSLLKLLGWAEAEPPSERLAATIQARLGDLAPARAEFVAAFAGLLVRVAYVDRSISEAERAVLASSSPRTPACRRPRRRP